MMRLIFLLMLVLASGCAAVGPNWRQPVTPLPAAFVGGTGGPVGQLSTRAWWEDYRDPLLDALIARGLQQSLDVLQAQERIRQAAAQVRETGLNQALDGSATLAYEGAGFQGADAPEPGFGNAPSGSTSFATTSDLGASFVIDLFGGIRRNREAAIANLAAAQADVGTVRLAWLADMIAAYSDARFYQQATTLTRATISTRQLTLDITTREFEAGAATTYDVAEAQALLDSAEADLPTYRARFNASVFAIAALMNEPAGPLMIRMERGAPQLRVPGNVATGVPADLLRNRPDLRFYESVLHAQVAEIGVAEAALYPSVDLTGEVSGVDSSASWNFGPSVSLAILDRGRLRASRDAQVSAAEQAEIEWRSAVVNAVEDVQVAQSNTVQFRSRVAALNKAAASYGRALDLAQENYANGAITLLNLLVTDRSEFAARIDAAVAQNNAVQEWAALQIAMGAGAVVEAAPAERAVQTASVGAGASRIRRQE